METMEFVRAWDNGHRELGAHWIRKGKHANLNNTLDSLMQADHVILVHDDGTVSHNVAGVWAPEISVDLDADGQITDAAERETLDAAKRAGWDVETGRSGQYTYGGPFMHTSEFIGGDLAEHVLSTPGYWVVVYPSASLSHCPDEDDRCDACTLTEEIGTGSWLIMHREA